MQLSCLCATSGSWRSRNPHAHPLQPQHLPCPPISCPSQAVPAGSSLLATLGGQDAVTAIVETALQRATADWRVKRFLPEAGACDPAARKHMVGFVCSTTRHDSGG